MANFDITRNGNVLTINGFTDTQIGVYNVEVDSLNGIVLIKAEDGAYQAEIHVSRDTVVVNGESFTGTAQELRDLLYTDVFVDLTGGGGSSSPTEFLYVSSPVNKVFRLDGTDLGKNRYQTPNDVSNFIVWDGDKWVITIDGNQSYKNSTDTEYPESQNWLRYDTDATAPISITRYHGTLQEVLEQISKPKEWPKVYRALLTQSGTDAPVATVPENTLGGEVVWSRTDVGKYTGTLLGAFNGVTLCFAQLGNKSLDATNVVIEKKTSDTVEMITFLPTDSNYDGFSNISLQILVYP